MAEGRRRWLLLVGVVVIGAMIAFLEVLSSFGPALFGLGASGASTQYTKIAALAVLNLGLFGLSWFIWLLRMSQELSRAIPQALKGAVDDAAQLAVVSEGSLSEVTRTAMKRTIDDDFRFVDDQSRKQRLRQLAVTAELLADLYRKG